MNQRLLKTVTAFAFGSVLAFSAVASAQQQSPPTGDAKKGQQLFNSVGCWECHGRVGQGGGFSGPRIAPMALPYEAFLQQLRTPQNSMPPYEPKVLSNADVSNIYAYLKSIPQPEPVKDIPILNDLH